MAFQTVKVTKVPLLYVRGASSRFLLFFIGTFEPLRGHLRRCSPEMAKMPKVPKVPTATREPASWWHGMAWHGKAGRPSCLSRGNQSPASTKSAKSLISLGRGEISMRRRSRPPPEAQTNNLPSFLSFFLEKIMSGPPAQDDCGLARGACARRRYGLPCGRRNVL